MKSIAHRLRNIPAGGLRLGILVLFLAVTFLPASAQLNEGASSEPFNLSQSGAASQPRLLASPDGHLQAFWWDRFDGLTTSVSQAEDSSEFPWSDPITIPTLSDALTSTPELVVDNNGWVHAFWIAAGNGQQTPLMHGQLRFGASEWTSFDILADSALAFDVLVSGAGQINVAYILTENNGDLPAGLYALRMNVPIAESGNSQSASEIGNVNQVVFSSNYFRLLTTELAYLYFSSGTDSQGIEKLYLAWEDPRKGEAYISISEDGGSSWTSHTLEEGELNPSQPRLATVGKGVNLLIWQSRSQGTCTLYQQAQGLPDLRSQVGDSESESADTWSAPTRILEDLTECPQSSRFFFLEEYLLWIWGEGTTNLYLAAWDRGKDAWSLPKNLSFSFEDPETQVTVSLNDLHTIFTGEELVVVGTDEATGEVWVTGEKPNAIELAFAPPPPWMSPQRFSQEGETSTLAALAVDGEGRAHAVWDQAPSETSLTSSLYYALGYLGAITRPVEIVPAAEEELHSHPALLYDPLSDRLHLTWSGGRDGKILYSRANPIEANSSGGWSPTQTLSEVGSASWPQIALDPTGMMFVTYVVPLNEARGVYIIRSEDGGETWSKPMVVFNAAAASWPMIDHPTFAVGDNGELFIAWVEAKLPGMGPPLGIFFTRSQDGGVTWSKPQVLAGAGFDWPRFTLASGYIHLLYANVATSRGVIYHRWAPVNQTDTWSTASPVPGWQEIAFPFGLAVSGPRSMHLVGVSASAGRLNYGIWDGERWSATEDLDESSRIGPGLGAAAAAAIGVGDLSVAWLAHPVEDRQGGPILFFTTRSIPLEELPATAASEPDSEASPNATPASDGPDTDQSTSNAGLEAPRTPTATPQLNTAPPPSESVLPPTALGGGLAALIVAGIYIGWLLWGRNRTS